MYYKINKDEKTATIRADEEGAPWGDFEIPATIDDESKTSYPVTVIGRDAFSMGNHLTSVVIPDSITTIEESAFFGCIMLTAIRIPASVVSIADDVFVNCIGLNSIEVDEDNPAYKSVDGILYNRAMTEVVCCPAGKNGTVVLLDTVTSIGAYAFADCAAITAIVLRGEQKTMCCERTKHPAISIPNTIKNIGNRAFMGCNDWASVHLPESVYSIGEQPFYLCSNMRSITVAENNPAYMSKDGILYNKDMTRLLYCPNATTGKVDIPATVATIDVAAFAGCKITAVNIPNSVTTIEWFAFSCCKELTELRIPDSVTSIAADAFLGCTKLASVLQSASLISLEGGAFWYCKQLSEISIPKTVTKIGGLAFNRTAWWENQPHGIIYKDGWCLGWKDNNKLLDFTIKEIVIEKGTKGVAALAFWYCEELTSVTIPDSVAYIGEDAFHLSHSLCITCYAPIPPTMHEGRFSRRFRRVTVYVPAQSVEAYRQAADWNRFNIQPIV